ncbi:HAD family hydrolase [Umezawaea tangerina]|uniref:HAD family hydrolase n=1 Tax=Umezawaea tangerina TaxID=84725 RepID=UPI000D04EE68|nr:HAD family hydrolase [Umezawaea tangerina]
MERPRLVASDIDGTLIGLDNRVSERTAAVVRRVIGSGTPFVLVTGRPPRWVSMIAEQVGTTGFVVCANGAALYDVGEDRVVWQRGLEPVLLSDLAEALREAIPDVAFASERVGATAHDDRVRPFVAERTYRHPWIDSDDVEVPLAEVLGRTAVKLLAQHDTMTSAEMALAAEAVLGEEVVVTFSTNSGLVELSAAGVTKATGLADVAERAGVPREDVVAFGDMPNDVPMLTWAGHGVAMANAHAEARAVADEVTAQHTDDGVALVLERWF